MENEIQKTLAQRAKDILQTSEEHSLFQLTDLLREFRNETHPDKFQGQELKQKAEVRFKEVQSLLDELDGQIERDRFNGKASEIVVYKPLFEAARLQVESESIRKMLKETQIELDEERVRNSALEEQLRETSDISLKEEISHLQQLYKPSSRKFASIGLGIVLTGALGVMSQMEKVSNILGLYSPWGREIISRGLFVCLVLFLVLLARKVWEAGYIGRRSEEMCSPQIADDFPR